MAIPAVLNNLLDYDNITPPYIWVKKGKKEEAWAVCALLGMVIDSDIELNGHPVANTYIFAPMPSEYADKYRDPSLYAIGVEARFHLRDLQAYFDQQEPNDVYNQPDRT